MTSDNFIACESCGNTKKIRIKVGTQWLCEDCLGDVRDKIAALEAELAEARRVIENSADDNLLRETVRLRARVAELEQQLAEAKSGFLSLRVALKVWKDPTDPVDSTAFREALIAALADAGAGLTPDTRGDR